MSLTLGLQEIVNPLDYLPVGFGFGNSGLLGGIPPYISSPDDHYRGRDEPFYGAQQDVDAARSMARWVTTLTCPGIGIVENLQNYIIGAGYPVTAATKRRRKAPAGLIDAVQEYVDEFLDDNDFIGDLDRELLWRLSVDGEFFLACYPQREGKMALRLIEPEQVTEPAGEPYHAQYLSSLGVSPKVATNWEFGIHTADQDVQEVFGYCLEWSVGDRQYLPARLVEHMKANVGRNVKRGRSDFYPAWRWLLQQEKVLRNTGEGAAELAAISYIIEYASASMRDVLSMRESMADISWTMTTAGGGRKTVRKEHVPPGTKLDVPEGQQYKPGPMGAERGQAFLEVVQGILRQVSTRWCMSEGQISGDDSNNSYASSVTAGSRFHRYAITRQAKLKTRFQRIIWKAVEHAHKSGRFSRFNLKWPEFLYLVEISAVPPSVDEQSMKDLEEVRRIRFEAGILSKKTWRSQAGLDHEQEEENLTEERGDG